MNHPGVEPISFCCNPTDSCTRCRTIIQHAVHPVPCYDSSTHSTGRLVHHDVSTINLGAPSHYMSKARLRWPPPPVYLGISCWICSLFTVVQQATMEWNSLLAEVHPAPSALLVLFAIVHDIFWNHLTPCGSLAEALNIWWKHSTSCGSPAEALDISWKHSTSRGSPAEALNIPWKHSTSRGSTRHLAEALNIPWKSCGSTQHSVEALDIWRKHSTSGGSPRHPVEILDTLPPAC